MGHLTRTARIVNGLGLHARAAARLATIAAQARGPVWILNDAERADATSIIDILALGCPMGTPVTIEIQNPQDLPVLEQILQLIAGGFGE